MKRRRPSNFFCCHDLNQGGIIIGWISLLHNSIAGLIRIILLSFYQATVVETEQDLALNNFIFFRAYRIQQSKRLIETINGENKIDSILKTMNINLCNFSIIRKNFLLSLD